MRSWKKGHHQKTLDIQREHVEHALDKSKKKGEACLKMAISGMLYDHAHWDKGFLNHVEATRDHASVTDSTQCITEILS